MKTEFISFIIRSVLIFCLTKGDQWNNKWFAKRFFFNFALGFPSQWQKTGKQNSRGNYLSLPIVYISIIRRNFPAKSSFTKNLFPSPDGDHAVLEMFFGFSPQVSAIGVIKSVQSRNWSSFTRWRSPRLSTISSVVNYSSENTEIFSKWHKRSRSLSSSAVCLPCRSTPDRL